MFKHQYDFNIEIPKEVIETHKHDRIFEDLLQNKVIIGLCGYGKSGKDFIAKNFVKDYGFHRVAFADNLKIQMNKYLKKTIYDYIGWAVRSGYELEDGRTLSMDDMDFQTEDIPVKKKLRPFIIWYGEMLREINGPYYWINQAFKIDAAGYDNIILSDVRRLKELEPFKDSFQYHSRCVESYARAGIISSVNPHILKPYSSLFFEVSQLGLTDGDSLTVECIRVARENWLFDDIFYVDPRIQEEGDSRDRAVKFQIKRIAKEFGISKPDKTISPRQTKMF